MPRCTFLLTTLILILFIIINFAHANVEKTIFIAPPREKVPTTEQSGLDDLGLPRLTPEPVDAVIRARLNASFPTRDAPRGAESWFFLEHLVPGVRYEVRICWLATVC